METLLAHMGEASGGGVLGCQTDGCGNGMMGGSWMMGAGASPVWGWTAGILWWLTWILVILALVALVRWLWKKGGK